MRLWRFCLVFLFFVRGRLEANLVCVLIAWILYLSFSVRPIPFLGVIKCVWLMLLSTAARFCMFTKLCSEIFVCKEPCFCLFPALSSLCTQLCLSKSATFCLYEWKLLHVQLLWWHSYYVLSCPSPALCEAPPRSTLYTKASTQPIFPNASCKQFLSLERW